MARYQGRYERAKPKKKGGKIALIVLCILLVLVIGIGLAGKLAMDYIGAKVTSAEDMPDPTATIDPAWLGNPDEEVEQTEEPTTVPTTLPYIPSNMDIVNILVIGQAGRAGEEHHMADSMMLLTVNKTTKTLHLTSFLRDTYVDMPNYRDPNGKLHTCGWNRINVCYNLGWTWGNTAGAMEMMTNCIKDNFGIEVDHCVEVDFSAVVEAINILGGVKIELTEAEANYLNKEYDNTYQTVTPGKNCLYGGAALAYARMRKAEGDGESDIRRTERQRNLVKALVKQCLRMSFDDLKTLAETILPMVTTNMTPEEITTCMWELLPMLPDLTIETGTCPVEKYYWGEMIDLNGYESSVLKFYSEQNKCLLMPITEGISFE